MVEKPTYQELEQRVKELEQVESERKHSEDELQKKEATIQSVFDATPVGICIMENRVYQRVNRDWCESFGYSEDKVIGRTTEFLYESHEEYERVGKDLYKNLLKKGIAFVRSRLKRSDGEFRDVDLIAKPLNPYDLKAGTVFVVHDITDRLKAEQALRESEERFRTTLDSIGDAVIATDTSGNVTSMNPVAEKLTGWSMEDAQGKPLTDVFNIVNALTKEKATNPVAKVLENGKIVGLANHTILIARDGAAYQIADSGAPIIDAGGNITGVVLVFRDVTEEYKMQEALRESDQFMISVFESIQDGISILNPDLSIRHVNGVMKKWYSENLPLEGKKCFECYHNANRPCDPCPTLRCLESGKTEMNIVPGLSDSDVEWIELYSYPIRHAETGEITGIVEFVRDITERKRAEEDLQHQTEIHKILMNISSKYINVPLDDVEGAVNAALGEIGEFVSADRAYVFNYDFEKNIAINTYEWCDEGIEPQIDNLQSISLDAAPDWVESHLKGEPVIIPDVSALPLGDLRDILEQQQINSLITVPMFHEDRLVGFAGFDSVKYFHIYSDMEIELINFFGQILVNLRMRIQSEEALRESEEKYRSMMESMKDEAYICSSDFSIQYLNPASVSRIGRDATGELCYRAIYGLDEECSWCIFDKVLQGKNVEHELLNPNNNRYYSISNSPIRHTDSSISKLAVCRDITDVKKMELQLKQAHKMEAIGTLAGGIAHQFNNVLSVIVSNIDLLEMDFPSDETIANYTNGMKSSAHRMTQLTAQLLAYARGGKYQAKTVLFSDFVRETLPLLKHALGSTIDVDTDMPRGILNVKADLTQMQMVLSAVLTNAAEAMEGKGRIRVACRDTIITYETFGDFPGLTPGNYVNLTIVDDGKGMDEETRTRIFEPFFTTKFQGRGLGMAATYGIVKNHDGWISVDSEFGKGTIVKIYLPVAETPVKEDAKPKPKT